MQNRRILLIDGNYLASRCLYNTKLSLKTEDEKHQFSQSMMYQFIKIWEVFSPHCSDVLVVSDSYSWRKKLQSYRPYYATDDTVIGYKETRKNIRKDQDIDMEAYVELLNDFTKKLDKIHRHINVQNLEGDDVLTLISAYHKNDNNTEFVVFCTDKDLGQIIRRNVSLFMNTYSKQHPSGYFWISPVKFHKQYSQSDDMLDKLMESTNKDVSFEALTKIDILDSAGIIKRTPHSGIAYVNRWALILEKTVCGDKSDNILPIIRWKSKTGTVNYSVTPKHINSTSMCADGVESCYHKVITDINTTSEFIRELLEITKQPASLYDKVMEHYKHNYQLVLLSEDMFPQDSVDSFKNQYKNLQINGLYGGITINDIRDAFDISSISSIHPTDDAFEFLRKSINQ